MIKVSAANTIDTLREDAYISVTDALTGELLFHGFRNVGKGEPWVSTTLFKPYFIVSLNRRWECKRRTDELVLVVNLEVATEEGLQELEEMERELAES